MGNPSKKQPKEVFICVEDDSGTAGEGDTPTDAFQVVQDNSSSAEASACTFYKAVKIQVVQEIRVVEEVTLNEK